MSQQKSIFVQTEEETIGGEALETARALLIDAKNRSVSGISPGESIDETLPIKAQTIDRAMAGLVQDLKQRGLFDDTLIVWGSEFGRTPMQQNSGKQPFIGRDHHPYAYTMWMAGGGIKGGQTIGETDDFGYYPTKDPVHVRDIQASVLHAMGLDPFRLSFPFSGLDQRLIGPENKAKLISKLFG